LIDSGKGTSRDVGIYIHIPYCKKKCHYCDFLSFLLPCGNEAADYIMGVKKELQLLAPRIENAKAGSLYFGGGTPSLLPLQYFREIVSAVKEQVLLSPFVEFTVEANPGTLSRENLRGMVSLGVNRLSLGVQSMNDRLLRSMGRLHTAEEAREAFYLAREEGMENISIDLMHGLPGQTLDDWRTTLEAVIGLNPEHISVYGLNLEPNTVWGDLYLDGELELPGEDECGKMYRMSRKVLQEAGFLQYEISNYARPGYECRHNLGYWYRRPYLGIGLGASSFIQGTRYKNYSDPGKYLQALDQDVLPIAEKEELSEKQAISETMFLGLRTAKGINQVEFTRQFGRSIDDIFTPVLQPLEKAGVIIREGQWLRLNPEYYAVSNEVFQKFV
jgi:oxygen-independent coproporphyrinogen-3 oxidase